MPVAGKLWQPGRIQPFIQKLFEVMVAGKFIDLAAFFMEIYETDYQAAHLEIRGQQAHYPASVRSRTR
jgi:hypothetical protein